ncbi:MAG: flavin monoamine oxidase family protein [Saprospiraceae bacterium]
MEKANAKIVILGAGLTGLTIAHGLQKIGVKAMLLEARERLGGRIHTVQNPDGAPIELGATWLGQQHQALQALVKELGLKLFPQRLGNNAIFEAISTSPPQLVKMPPNQDPSFRIAGGTSTLINRLTATIADTQIKLGEVVQSIDFVDEKCQLKTEQNSYTADIVISTLPPNLLVNTINFSPALSTNLVEIAEQTHTWMGESIKVGLRFPTAFWRAANLSGTVFSNVGPVSEMYDHANVEDTNFALKGFLSGGLYGASREQRLNLILQQLRKYYGTRADEYSAYEEAVWRLERFSFFDYKSYLLPHQNNGHEALLDAYYDGRFFLAGAETSTNFGGYMEGAVLSAHRIVARLSSLLKGA